MTASAAVSAFGIILQLSDGGSPAVYTSIAEIRTIGEIGGEREMIDVSNMDSPGQAKEYIAGMLDSLMCALELNYLPQNATHKDMLTNIQQQTVANIFRDYRIVLPDFGAVALTGTVNTGTDVWTTSTHGFNTAQPITFTTSGTLPTSSPQIYAGTIYWARRASSSTFKVYTTAANAIADSSAIDFSTSGSGTHTVNGGTVFTFRGAFKSAKNSGSTNTQLKISTELKVTGVVTQSP
jgi:predicted secreted protein